ncbi:MAG: cyclase family protein [Candidatus Vogelbacteria bacterium]|nr:cyclase family protein [Candidatus Vogelbacteria bacterium]
MAKNKSKNKFIKISYDIEPAMPIFEGNRPNKVEAVDSFKSGQTWNSYYLGIGNHNGTHIDAPNHFCPTGKRICDFEMSDFVFSAITLVDIPKKAGDGISVNDLAKIPRQKGNCDLLLLRTGFHKQRGRPAYTNNNPWLTQEAANFIRSKFRRLRAIGIDTVSIASLANLAAGGESHRILLDQGAFKSSPVMVIEDLNLAYIPMKIKRLFAIPLFVTKVDSMPCTAFIEA